MQFSKIIIFISKRLFSKKKKIFGPDRIFTIENSPNVGQNFDSFLGQNSRSGYF